MNAARPPSRRWFRAFIVFLTIALLWAVWHRPIVQQHNTRVLRPEKTKRAIAARARPNPKPPGDDAPPGATESASEGVSPVTVWVYPRPDGSWEYPDKPSVRMSPTDYWPTDDEAPWPDLNSSDALQELAEALRNPLGQLGEAASRFIEEAEHDGLLDRAETAEFDDPWAGLVAMQAEYVRTVLETGLWPEAGSVDFGQGLDIAQSIVDEWPDDPAAEYARLHLLQVANHPESTRYDTAETMRQIVDIIDTTQDALVLEVALAEFTAIHEGAFDDRTIDAVERVYRHAESTTQHGIIATMLTHHVQNNDWDQVDAWTARLLEHEDQTIETAANARANNARSIASDLAGYRAVRGTLTATTWREELSATVHMCHDDHPIDRAIGGEAEWNDGWEWNAWWGLSRLLEDTNTVPEAPHFIDCVRNTAWRHAPPPGTLLTIKVIR